MRGDRSLEQIWRASNEKRSKIKQQRALNSALPRLPHSDQSELSRRAAPPFEEQMQISRGDALAATSKD